MFKITTKKLALLAILMALGVMLKFFSIGDGHFRISVWDIPLLIAGILTGPFWGGVCALGADLIYSLGFSSYPFSFIMMFTTIVWGVAGGFFYKKKVNLWILVLVVLVTSIVATGINSVYLTIHFGWQSMVSGLPMRLITMIIKIPLTALSVFGVIEAIKGKLEYSKW